MKTRFSARFNTLWSDLLPLHTTVDPDPAGDGAGDAGGAGGDGTAGGATGTSGSGAAGGLSGGDDPEAHLGDPGKRALAALRADNDALKRQLAEIQRTHPAAVSEAKERAEQLERQLREREQLTEAERLRLERKHQDQLAKATETATQERQRRINLEIRTAARAAFDAAHGRDGADEAGLTFFDGFMALVGSKHLRLDEAAGQVYVVDGQGDPILSADGKGRVSPIEWMNQQADGSPVVGSFFRSRMGEGSGGFVGARGQRGGVVARDPQQAIKAGTRDFLSAAYPG